MARLAKRETLRAMRAGRILIVTPGVEKTFSLDNGEGVSLRTGIDMTGQLDLPGFSKAPDLIANEDGLFPGITQTWRTV